MARAEPGKIRAYGTDFKVTAVGSSQQPGRKVHAAPFSARCSR